MMTLSRLIPASVNVTNENITSETNEIRIIGLDDTNFASDVVDVTATSNDVIDTAADRNASIEQGVSVEQDISVEEGDSVTKLLEDYCFDGKCE